MEFNKRDFKAIVAPTELKEWDKVSGHYKIKKSGVYPAVRFDPTLKVETNLLAWRPAEVFADDPNPPDVAETPSLPFPFTERQLAAFMLDGVGAFVAERYGEWADGPDHESLDEIPKSEARARAAVKAAFSVYRETRKAIGLLDDEWPATDAMVRELLKPVPEPQSPRQGAAKRTEALPSPDYDLLATHKQLIQAFGSFTGMDQSWFDNLSDKPALLKARKVEGVSGHRPIPAMFCPLEVMNWLSNPKRKTGRSISQDKAWERLEQCFPKVYSAHSVGDPRE